MRKSSERDKSPNPLDIALGAHIRSRRNALSMSQTELASAVGITFQQVQKYERGSNRVSFSRLVEIAHALSCRAVDLIGELDDGVPHPSFQRDTAHLRVKGASDLIAAYADLPPALRKALLRLLAETARCTQLRAAPRPSSLKA